MARGCPRPRRGTKGSFLTAVGAWLAGALPMQSPPPSPEPQAAQGAPGLAVAGLEDCVYLSVAALQEGTAALRRWRARPSHLHGPQHRGRLGPGARDRPRQPRPGGRGRDSQDLAAVATAVAQCAAFWAAAPTFAIQPAPL